MQIIAHRLLAAALLATALLPATVSAASKVKPENRPVAVVNGVAIPQSLADYMLAEQKRNGGQETPEIKAAIRDRLITGEIMAQEARKKGLDKLPATATQIELSRMDILTRATVEDYMKSHQITDADLKSEYDRIKATITGNEYKSRHILLEKQEDARKIIARLKKGEKFEELAKLSIDQGSRNNGGELGWSLPTAFVSSFANAMTGLKIGKITEEPVQTQFGWHIIRLDDVRAIKAPTFEESKEQLRGRLQQAKSQKLIMDLKSKASIK